MRSVMDTHIESVFGETDEAARGKTMASLYHEDVTWFQPAEFGRTRHCPRQRQRERDDSKGTESISRLLHYTRQRRVHCRHAESRCRALAIGAAGAA